MTPGRKLKSVTNLILAERKVYISSIGTESGKTTDVDSAHVRTTGDQQFLQGYWETTLWKPQIVADNVLTRIYLADASYRSALAVLMLQECVESARRLATIVLGLTNSSGNLAQYLREPLAGATGWRSMVDIIENRSSAEELIEMLHLNFQAEQSVNELLDTRGLIHYAVPISLYRPLLSPYQVCQPDTKTYFY